MKTKISDDYADLRDAMVKEQVESRGIKDTRVLAAMRKIPREAFVPADLQAQAYDDIPLPIGCGQTISQPYIVGLMCEALALDPTDNVLEIGTGSGYAAAVLSQICAKVNSVERIEKFSLTATDSLQRLGYTNVEVCHADGTIGWPQHAPYSAIVVTAGGPRIPPTLKTQLAIGGRLVMPVGELEFAQQLIRLVRTGKDSYQSEDLGDVRFVPLIGREGWKAERSLGSTNKVDIVYP